MSFFVRSLRKQPAPANGRWMHGRGQLLWVLVLLHCWRFSGRIRVRWRRLANAHMYSGSPRAGGSLAAALLSAALLAASLAPVAPVAVAPTTVSAFGSLLRGHGLQHAYHAVRLQLCAVRDRVRRQ